MAATTENSTIVLITGANQGIGFEIAKKLGKDHANYHIIMAGRRKEAIEEAVKNLQSLGCSVEPLVMDITSDEAIAQAAAAVDEIHGRLDVLINNAGISTEGDTPTREAWRQDMETNVISTNKVTDAFIPLLRKSTAPCKRIVFVSTSLASMGDKLNRNDQYHKVDWRIYRSSKAAFNMLAASYIVDFEDDPTWKINIHDPGYCGTNLNGFKGFDTPENGALNACRLATLGPGGETGTFSNRHGPVAW